MSDLGLHNLLKPVCPTASAYYGIVGRLTKYVRRLTRLYTVCLGPVFPSTQYKLRYAVLPSIIMRSCEKNESGKVRQCGLKM